MPFNKSGLIMIASTIAVLALLNRNEMARNFIRGEGNFL